MKPPVVAVMLQMVMRPNLNTPDQRTQIFFHVITGPKDMADLLDLQESLSDFTEEGLELNITIMRRIIDDVIHYYNTNHKKEIEEQEGQISREIRTKAREHFNDLSDNSRPTNRPPAMPAAETGATAVSGIQKIGGRALDVVSDREVETKDPRQNVVPEQMTSENIKKLLQEILQMTKQYKQMMELDGKTTGAKSRTIELGIKAATHPSQSRLYLEEVQTIIAKKFKLPASMLLWFSPEKKIDLKMLADDIEECLSALPQGTPFENTDQKTLKSRLAAAFSEIDVTIQYLIDTKRQPDAETLNLMHQLRAQRDQLAF